MGLMPLDQGVFQHQGLKLAGGHDDVKVRHLVHHGLYLGQMLPVEIAADPVFQLLGLANVYHFALFIQHDIHPRQQGQMIGFFSQGIKHTVNLFAVM